MVTWYVNKSGSDTYDGNSQTFVSGTTGPKLTIQAMVTAASNLDVIYVGSGSYNERVATTVKGLTLYADGVVVMDGAGLLGTGSALSFTNLAAANYMVIAKAPTGGKWVIKNYNGNAAVSPTLVITASANPPSATSYISDMELYGNVNNTTGFSPASAYQGHPIVIRNCIFSGYSGYGILPVATGGGVSPTLYVTYSTFYNCGYGCVMSAGNGLMGWCYNNLFHTCGIDISKTAGAPGALVNFNSHYNWATLILKVGASLNYATLAAAQAVGCELNGFDSDPGLVDPANGVFFLSSTGDYGAYPYSSIARGSGYNPDSKWVITGTIDTSGPGSGWYNPDGNVTKNGTSNNFELSSGTSGVIWSPVYDLGSVQLLTQLNIAAVQTWGTNMLDKTNTDTAPNYQTVEVRASLNSFNQNDGSLNWTEVKMNMPFASAIAARYAQLKVTFRSDDVSA
ncbi:MAG: hypothetical protein WC746_05370 [archaeon]|jgi:hypothetical protein